MADPDSTKPHSDAAPSSTAPAPVPAPHTDPADLRIDHREEDRLDLQENARRPRSESRNTERALLALYLVLAALLIAGLLFWRHLLPLLRR